MAIATVNFIKIGRILGCPPSTMSFPSKGGLELGKRWGFRSQFRVTFRALACVAVRHLGRVAHVKSTFHLLKESALIVCQIASLYVNNSHSV